MDETNRRALLKTTDTAIKQVKAELDKLEAFRAWISNVGTPESPVVGTVEADESSPGPSTADYIEAGFQRAGPASVLSIPGIVQWAAKAGWATTSENPEQVIRTTVGRMIDAGRVELTIGGDQSGNRRYHLVGPRR